MDVLGKSLQGLAMLWQAGIGLIEANPIIAIWSALASLFLGWGLVLFWRNRRTDRAERREAQTLARKREQELAAAQQETVELAELFLAECRMGYCEQQESEGEA